MIEKIVNPLTGGYISKETVARAAASKLMCSSRDPI